MSVIPTTSIKPGQTAYTGALGDFKWLGKYYEEEVLGISGERTTSVARMCIIVHFFPTKLDGVIRNTSTIHLN